MLAGMEELDANGNRATSNLDHFSTAFINFSRFARAFPVPHLFCMGFGLREEY